MRSKIAEAGLIGAGLGAVIAAALAALRWAAGYDSVLVDGFSFRDYVEIALAPSTKLWVAQAVGAMPVDRQEVVEACFRSVAFNGAVYGVVAVVAAVAARWRRWLGVLALSIAGLWILFWLVGGCISSLKS